MLNCELKFEKQPLSLQIKSGTTHRNHFLCISIDAQHVKNTEHHARAQVVYMSSFKSQISTFNVQTQSFNDEGSDATAKHERVSEQ